MRHGFGDAARALEYKTDCLGIPGSVAKVQGCRVMRFPRSFSFFNLTSWVPSQDLISMVSVIVGMLELSSLSLVLDYVWAIMLIRSCILDMQEHNTATDSSRLPSCQCHSTHLLYSPPRASHKEQTDQAQLQAASCVLYKRVQRSPLLSATSPMRIHGHRGRRESREVEGCSCTPQRPHIGSKLHLDRLALGVWIP